MRLITTAILILILISCHRNNNKLSILFDNVEGLEKGASVYYKGFIVGKVTYLDLFRNKVVVDIKLNDRVHIPIDSRFIINTSMIGDTHITIEPSTQTSFLSSKDTVVGEYTKQQLLDDFRYDTARQKKVKESLRKIGEGIKELIEASKDTVKNLR